MLNSTNSKSTSARQTGAHESVSFREMCEQVGHQHITVLVDSYGYMERGVFSSHFEPFRNKRQFTFVLDWFDDSFWLCHVGRGGNSWLNFEDEDNELFYQDENGEWHCIDPFLFTRPSYDE